VWKRVVLAGERTGVAYSRAAPDEGSEMANNTPAETRGDTKGNANKGEGNEKQL
jgi:hypothetical protein